MLFKDLTKTNDYKLADVIEFINRNGKEIQINDLENKTLLNTKVESYRLKNGLLEITLNY